MIADVHKGETDALKHGNYTGLKLLHEIKKVTEKVQDGMIKEEVDTAVVQLGSEPERGTTNL